MTSKGHGMVKKILIQVAGLFSAFLLPAGSAVHAQQLADRPRTNEVRSLAYNSTQESVFQGTVLSYTAESAEPPLGAHVVLQTSNGVVDVHLGAAAYLQANHFSLTQGDAVRVFGVSSTTRQGTIFLARVIQKGTQSLALRTPQGAPLSRAGARAMGAQKAQAQGQPQEGPR